MAPGTRALQGASASITRSRGGQQAAIAADGVAPPSHAQGLRHHGCGARKNWLAEILFQHVQYRQRRQASPTQEYRFGLVRINLPRQRVYDGYLNADR
ncbi:MAG TPA: hypothetical protein VI542_36660 [Candidatus Tectomicrobia bacterium]